MKRRSEINIIQPYKPFKRQKTVMDQIDIDEINRCSFVPQNLPLNLRHEADREIDRLKSQIEKLSLELDSIRNEKNDDKLQRLVVENMNLKEGIYRLSHSMDEMKNNYLEICKLYQIPFHCVVPPEETDIPYIG